MGLQRVRDDLATEQDSFIPTFDVYFLFTKLSSLKANVASYLFIN